MEPSLRKEREKESLPPRPPGSSVPSFELPEVLRGDDPLTILARLLESDPFEIRARCARHAREEAAVVNTARLALNTMGRIALAARAYAAQEPIEEWVEISVAISLKDMLAEQRDEERRGLRIADSPDAEFYTSFAQIAGIRAHEGRSACVVLNSLSLAHREAFHAVVLSGMPLADWAALSGRTPQAVGDLLREVGLEVMAGLTQRSGNRRRKWL